MTACADKPRIETVIVTPPDSLIQDCPITDSPIVTNGDMARAIRSLRADLARCNTDKAALREWKRLTAKK